MAALFFLGFAVGIPVGGAIVILLGIYGNLFIDPRF